MSDGPQDPQSTPPGWYTDPSGTTRWWDGTQWGQAAAETPPTPPAPPTPPPTPPLPPTPPGAPTGGFAPQPAQPYGSTEMPQTTLSYYASEDAQITTDDTLLYSVTVGPLAARQCIWGAWDNVPAPTAPSGAVLYIGGLGDPSNTLLEMREDNNATSVWTLTIQ